MGLAPADVVMSAEQVTLTLDVPFDGDLFEFEDALLSDGDSVGSTVGLNNLVAAPATYEANGIRYRFSHWADNPSPANVSRIFTTPDVDAVIQPVYVAQ